ncbi:MAG: hypothetical protein QXL52_01120 [Nitrososphaerales archaeon]
MPETKPVVAPKTTRIQKSLSSRSIFITTKKGFQDLSILEDRNELRCERDKDHCNVIISLKKLTYENMEGIMIVI